MSGVSAIEWTEILRTEVDAVPELNRASRDDVVHEVGWLEWLLADVLRLKIPRALCGELLLGDANWPGPGPTAPRCPRCAGELDGRTWDQYPNGPREVS